ncbi:MAG: hypothetical protein LBD46_02720 [Endomicrobium sp.]|jgi:hypothetical protein|nr:hypothetical protein [Endomicrobium sp.]
MEKIKENVVKYGRLILDISVVVEAVVVVLYFLISSITVIARGSFLYFLISLVTSVIALLAIIVFNYLVYLIIDIRDSLIKLTNK